MTASLNIGRAICNVSSGVMSIEGVSYDQAQNNRSSAIKHSDYTVEIELAGCQGSFEKRRRDSRWDPGRQLVRGIGPSRLDWLALIRQCSGSGCHRCAGIRVFARRAGHGMEVEVLDTKVFAGRGMMLMCGRASECKARISTALITNGQEGGTEVYARSDHGYIPKRRRLARDKPPDSGPWSERASAKVGSAGFSPAHG